MPDVGLLLTLGAVLEQLDLRVALQRVIVRVLLVGFAEDAGDFEESIGRQLLIAEEQHPMVDDRASQLDSRRIVERLAEVDSRDDGADAWPEALSANAGAPCDAREG